MDRWSEIMRLELAEILDRSDTLVARGDDKSTQYAWACFEGDDLLHYVYTWEAYRDRGVARALLKAAGLIPKFVYSCQTVAFEQRFVWDRVPRPKFNPLPARFGNRPRRKHVEVVQAARP
jgi:GNAT superfamily N-acetyltransferase